MHLTSAVMPHIPMANNEFILLCTAHLFPLTDCSFFSPSSSVCKWEIPFFYVYIRTLYISCFLLCRANARMPHYSQCWELLSKHFLLLLISKTPDLFLCNTRITTIYFFFPNLFIKSQSHIYWNWLEICHGALPSAGSLFWFRGLIPG